MKRVLIIIFALTILLSFASCGKAPASESKESAQETIAAEPAKTESAKPEPEPEPEPDIEYPINTSANKFFEAKTAAIEMLNEAASGGPAEIDFGLFAISSIDFVLLPVQVIDDVAKGDADTVGYPDATGEVKWTGFVYDFSMDYKEEDKDVHMQGSYDYKTDSITATFTVDGVTGIYFEYVKDDKGGYVSQCSMLSSDKPDTFSVMSMAFSDKDVICGVKNATKDTLPDAIYGVELKDPAEFIKNDEFFVTYIGGKGTSVIMGQKEEF